MAKKINMATADRALAVRVSEFATFYMSKIADAKRHSMAVKGIEDTIKGLNNALGSALDKDTTIAAINAQMTLLEQENQRYAQLIEKKAKWVWYEEDLDLYEAIKKGEGVRDAVIAWLQAWGLEDVDRHTNLVRDMVDAVGGKRFGSARTIVNSGATTWTASRTKADVLKVAYAVVIEYMVAASTIKAVDIPEDIREAFAPKKKSAK